MWLGSEFYAALGNEVAIRLTPSDRGTLQIFFDGETVYDKKVEDGVFPDVNRVKAMKADLKRRVEDLVPVG
jgi:predicted Rdx family selenoprotein